MNFFKKIINKITGNKRKEIIKPQNIEEEQKESKRPESQTTTIKEKSDEEIISELNTLAPGIFSQAKTPEMKKLIIDIYRKMLEDGVDVRNEKEVEKWMEKNQNKLMQPSHKIETYKREKPKIGRNDPCPCGSGKKYKKCCGAKE